MEPPTGIEPVTSPLPCISSQLGRRFYFILDLVKGFSSVSGFIIDTYSPEGTGGAFYSARFTLLGVTFSIAVITAV